MEDHVPAGRLWRAGADGQGAGLCAVLFTGGWLTPESVGLTTLWAAAALTLVTGWDYLRVGLKHMDEAGAGHPAHFFVSETLLIYKGLR